MSEFVTKDSGARTEFGTGSVRDIETGKADWTLLPFVALERFLGLMQRGAGKYGRHNWSKGQSIARAERSMFRHMVQYLKAERDEDHLAAVVFNACLILDHEDRIAKGELPAHLDDRDEFRRTSTGAVAEGTHPRGNTLEAEMKAEAAFAASIGQSPENVRRIRVARESSTVSVTGEYNLYRESVMRAAAIHQRCKTLCSGYVEGATCCQKRSPEFHDVAGANLEPEPYGPDNPQFINAG